MQPCRRVTRSETSRRDNPQLSRDVAGIQAANRGDDAQSCGGAASGRQPSSRVASGGDDAQPSRGAAENEAASRGETASRSSSSSNNRNISNSSVIACNCRLPDECPLSGHCCVSAVIYKATVSTDQEARFYIGATETTFKTRYNNHKQSLEKREKINETTLSKYIWDLKDKNTTYAIKWEIIQRSTPYRCGTRFCQLCLCEKYCILTSDPVSCLNKNSELLQKCRHKNKFKLNMISTTSGDTDVGVT